MIDKGLAIIAQNPKLIGVILERLGLMPNIEMPTLGGEVFWTDIASHNGWRVQKNNVFGNCRILDPKDVRKAWGGKTDILHAFTYLVENINKYQLESQEEVTHDAPSVDPTETLAKLGQLYRDGVLTKEEFESKKKKYLNML